jgi:outer membrane protein assembly factor BamB
MFHVKQRSLGLALAIVLLSLLGLSCGGGAAGPRGWAAPVLEDDLLIVSTSKGRLNGIEAGTSKEAWRFPTYWALPKGAGGLSGIYGPPVLSRDGSVIYVGDYNGYVYAFRPADYETSGIEKPKAGAYKVNDSVIGGIALDPSSDVLYVTAGASVYSIRASELTARIGDAKADVTAARLFRAKREIWSVPVLAGGKLFVSSIDGNLYALDPRTGALSWRFDAGDALASTPLPADANGDGQPDLILVGGFDSRLHALDMATGRERWSFQASNWVWGRPAVESDRVYFGDFDGNLYALNLSNGALAWSVGLNMGAIRAAPAVAGGLVVVATEDGWLVGVNPANQGLSWQKKIDAKLNADLVRDGSDVLIAPSRCVTPVGATEKVYYVSVSAQTGELSTAEGVCS